MSTKNKSSHEEEKAVDLNEQSGETEQPENEQSNTDQLSKNLNEQKDKYIRLMAEFENFRKRTNQEKIDILQMAGKDVIKSLLPVLDDWERAEKAITDSTDPHQIIEGNKLIFTKLRSILESKGLKQMDYINQPFDVDTQEAISQVNAGEDMKGKVVDELEKGYFLNDKILRFAKVIVGS